MFLSVLVMFLNIISIETLLTIIWTINTSLVNVIKLAVLTIVGDWLVLIAASAAFDWVVSGVHEETTSCGFCLSLVRAGFSSVGESEVFSWSFTFHSCSENLQVVVSSIFLLGSLPFLCGFFSFYNIRIFLWTILAINFTRNRNFLSTPY